MKKHLDYCALVIGLVFTFTACGKLASPTPGQEAIPPTPAPTTAPTAILPLPTASATATQAIEVDASGSYQVAGKNPDGSDYACQLEVAFKDGVYHWHWTSCGEYDGLGIQQGKIISVAWGPSDCQVAAYDLQEDGSWVARWAPFDFKAFGTEIAKPDKVEAGISGLYKISGTTPDGSPYAGTLEATTAGNIYHLVKDTGKKVTGVGIQRDHVISAAFGSEGCSVLSYLIHEDKSMESLWAYVGDPATGSEVVSLPGAIETPSLQAGQDESTENINQQVSDAPAQPSAGCGKLPPAAVGETTKVNITVNGMERMYLLHLPPQYDPNQPTSLVLSIHGYTDSARGWEAGTRMSSHADQFNYIVIYPQATSFENAGQAITSWNDLTCNASPGPAGPICSVHAIEYPFPTDCGAEVDKACNWCTCNDDLSYVRQVLDEAEANLCVDLNRVYATGMSNGGMFTHRLGCDLANRFAAIAPVAGTLAKGFNCAPAPSNQISMMSINGLEDHYVDVTGKESSDGYFYTAIDDVMALWASPASQGCDAAVTPYPTSVDGTRSMACTQHANCATGAEVVSCWWDARHDWPGFGMDMIWNFFMKNAKTTQPPVEEIVISPAEKHQTLEGFGASGAWWAQDIGGWEDEIRSQITRLLFNQTDGIGLSLYRYNIGGGDGENILDPWRRTQTFEVSPGVYDWSRDANAVWVLKAAQAEGVEQFVAFANSPPARMTVSGSTTGGTNGESNLQPEMYNDFAQYLVDVVHHLREEEGIPIGWISPVNEPQWDWGTKNGQEGCHYEPEEVLEVTRALLHAIDANGLDVNVSVFESGEWKKSPDYIDQLLNDPEVAPRLNHLAIHSYWSSLEEKVPVADFLEQRFPGTKVWMTEWTEMKEGRDTGMDSALVLANTIHEDLSFDQVTSWQYWIAVSRYNYRDGLVYVTYPDHGIIETKRLWAMGNFSRYVRPGYVRVEAKTQADGVEVSAYQAPDQSQYVVIVINNLDAPHIMSMNGLPSDFTQAVIYETSDQHNLEQVYRGQSPSTVIIPAKSVTTLVYTLP